MKPGLLLILLTWTPSLLMGQTEDQQCLASALPMLQQRKLADAEAKLSACQRHYPQSAILSNAIGIVYEQEGRKQEATKAFEKALELLPSFTAAQIHLGTLYAGAGNCDAANRLLSTAAASTSDSGALVASGAGLARCHDLPGAMKAFEKALQANPQSVPAANNLVLAALDLIHQERFGEVAGLLENSPPTVDVLSILGLARFRLGRYREAIVAYSKAITLDPSLEAAREGLGFLLYMTGDLERARSVVEAGDSSFYLLYLRALILYRESPGLRAKALASVSAAIEKNPKFAPAYFLRGKIRSDQNEPAAALKDFQTAVQIDPKYSLPYYRMARIYSAMGRAAEAAEAARQFSALGSLREDDVLAGQAKAHLTPEPGP